MDETTGVEDVAKQLKRQIEKEEQEAFIEGKLSVLHSHQSPHAPNSDSDRMKATIAEATRRSLEEHQRVYHQEKEEKTYSNHTF